MYKSKVDEFKIYGLKSYIKNLRVTSSTELLHKHLIFYTSKFNIKMYRPKLTNLKFGD
jgi:hypothetical protein